MTTDYSFQKTELRVMQNTYDNEEFLRVTANLIGKLTDERDQLKEKLDWAEHEL